MNKLLSLTIPGPSGGVAIKAPEGVPTHISIGNLFGVFFSGAMIIGILLALVFLTYGGFYWITSKGDKETLDKARRIINSSIIGLIIMSLALVLVNLIGTAVGVKTLVTK